MKELDSLNAIRATYDDLDAWQARAKRMPPEQPERGSLLDADSMLFPSFPISEAARMSLVASGEHLRLARTALEARQVYPSAHFTVLRGALVGTAQAVWILAPLAAGERQEHGLTLIGEMYDQLARYYGKLKKTPLTAEQKQELRDQIEWCGERQQQVAALRRTDSHFNQTEIITWALHHRFRDTQRRAAGRLLWRQMSADAHVLAWGVYQRGTTLQPQRGSGLAIGESGGSLEHIAEPFIATHLLLKEGWSLFDRLCESV